MKLAEGHQNGLSSTKKILISFFFTGPNSQHLQFKIMFKNVKITPEKQAQLKVVTDRRFITFGDHFTNNSNILLPKIKEDSLRLPECLWNKITSMVCDCCAFSDLANDLNSHINSYTTSFESRCPKFKKCKKVHVRTAQPLRKLIPGRCWHKLSSVPYTENFETKQNCIFNRKDHQRFKENLIVPYCPKFRKISVPMLLRLTVSQLNVPWARRFVYEEAQICEMVKVIIAKVHKSVNYVRWKHSEYPPRKVHAMRVGIVEMYVSIMTYYANVSKFCLDSNRDWFPFKMESVAAEFVTHQNSNDMLSCLESFLYWCLESQEKFQTNPQRYMIDSNNTVFCMTKKNPYKAYITPSPQIKLSADLIARLPKREHNDILVLSDGGIKIYPYYPFKLSKYTVPGFDFGFLNK